MVRNPEIRFLPLDLGQAKEFALLSAVRNPFDRLIVAAARSVGCPLLSADEGIAASGLVRVIWEWPPVDSLIEQLRRFLGQAPRPYRKLRKQKKRNPQMTQMRTGPHNRASNRNLRPSASSVDDSSAASRVFRFLLQDSKACNMTRDPGRSAVGECLISPACGGPH
jgi:hypothetical protein